MDLHNVGKTSSAVRRFSAVIGGSAVIAMGALGIAIGQEHGGADAVAMSGPMSVGATSTQTTPSIKPATAAAKPTIKGPAPMPSEEAAAK